MSDDEPASAEETSFEYQIVPGERPIVLTGQHRVEVADKLYDLEVADYKAHLGFQESIGQAVIRSLVLLNGGAIAGILTFIGNHGSDIVAADIRVAMKCFICGLVSAVAAPFAGFIAQLQFQQGSLILISNFLRLRVAQQAESNSEKVIRRGQWALYFGMVMLLLSLVLFVAGSFSAVDALNLTNDNQTEIAAPLG